MRPHIDEADKQPPMARFRKGQREMLLGRSIRQAGLGAAIAAVLAFAPLQPAFAQTELIIAQGAGPTTLDPLKEQAGPIMNISTQMFDALVRRADDGTIEPALATSWETVSDTEWVFKLRSGVQFHNGEAFDANAVKFSLDRVLDKNRSSQARARLPQLVGVDVIDPLTVRIHTSGPAPTLLSGLVWALILPPKYTEEQGDEFAAQNPVGTGPFKFVSWRQGDVVQLAANADHFRGRPKVDALTVRQIPEDSTRMATLLAGEAHIILPVSADLVPTIESSGDAHTMSEGSLMGLVIGFDTVRGPLVDKKIRQAINYAIDKESLISNLLQGQGSPLQGQVLTPGAFGFNPDLEPYPYDPERAKALLKEAGVGDGLTLTLNTPVGFYVADREVAIAVAGQLQKVGITVNVEPKEVGVFIQDLRANNLGPMFLIAWYSYGDAAFVMTHFSSASSFGIYQENAEFDDLVRQGQSQMDPDARAKAYKGATELMYEEAPMAFLIRMPTIYGVSNRVTGFEPQSDERWNLLNVELTQ